MKRIGIVTFFQSYNYGVWFQAYATQAFLRGRGYDAQIVNYSNLHDDEKLKMAFKGKNSYMGYLISFAKNILFGGMHYYRKGFKKHLNTFYSLSTLLSGENSLKQLLLTNNHLVSRLIKFFD